MSVTFQPIGAAKTANGRYEIKLEEQYAEGILGLAEFSHIQVVWWFNLYDSEEARKCLVLEKPYKNGPETIGVLATRGPIRPNPIAISVCKLLKIDTQRNVIEVEYLDAENDTPILDIKPYHPSSDKIRDVKMPRWCIHWPSCYEDSGTFNWDEEFNFPQ